MIKALFGPSSLTGILRGGLEETSATHHRIAQRVAGALESSSSTDFASQLGGQNGESRLDEVDLERDMTELADTQLRYEADAKLLQAAYGRLRAAIGNRG